MKATAITVIVIALYLLYRIARQKSGSTKQGGDLLFKTKIDEKDVVGRSRFVPVFRSQSTPTASIIAEPENQEEKPIIFASENSNAVIAPEELDEVFAQSEPMEIDYPLERVETEEWEEPDAEEEAEEFRLVFGGEAILASGFTYEEMVSAIEEDNPNTGRILSGLEKTDLFEQLISGDAVRAVKITAVVEQFLQSIRTDEPEDEDSTDYGDFDIADFLEN